MLSNSSLNDNKKSPSTFLFKDQFSGENRLILKQEHMYSKPPKKNSYTFLTLFANRTEVVFSCLSLFMSKGLGVYFHEPELRR